MRMLQARGDPFKVVLSTDQQECVSGASYVVMRLRVGRMEASRQDEYLGKRHILVSLKTGHYNSNGGAKISSRTVEPHRVIPFWGIPILEDENATIFPSSISVLW